MIWIGRQNRSLGVPSSILEPGTTLPELTGHLSNIIMYKFYRKPMATRTPLHHRSAVPEKDKVQTAVNEIIRRFKNTSRSLEVTHIEEVISEYCNDLQRGGFSPKWTKTVLEAAAKGYARMVTAEMKDGSPINRPEKSGRKARRVKRLTGKSTWFKRKPKGQDLPNTKKANCRSTPGAKVQAPASPETVLFVPHTPNSELKKVLQKVDTEVSGRSKYGRVKVIEKKIRSENRRKPQQQSPMEEISLQESRMYPL